MPILEREQVSATLTMLNGSPEQYGLITAICAVVILQPELLEPVSDGPFLAADAPSCEFFVQETLRAREFCNYIDQPTLASVQTSFFLFAALFCLDKDNSAWFYLREAMTLLQLQSLDEETTYVKLPDDQYATNCRRTFWLLFITERAYALQRNRPITLKRTINLPTANPGSESTILHGFLDLVSLFQNVDNNLLSLWNLSSVYLATPAHHLTRLQNILKFALPDVCQRTEIQQADLLISRQWLRIMVWRLCVIKGLLSSSPTSDCLSFQYPIDIARGVVVVSHLLSPKTFEAHGVGILEKVFDIGCSLADVLLLYANSMSVSGLEIGPRDYLMELVKILGTFSGGSSKYLGMLAVKADECLQVRITTGLAERETRPIKERGENDNWNEEAPNCNLNDGPSFELSALDRVNDLGGDPRIVDQLAVFNACPQTCQFADLSTLFFIERRNDESQTHASLFTPEFDQIFASGLNFY
jgi:Fungal specific transcription factor domain